ncbi:MAG: hypothetical protein R3Y10_05190 [Ferrimonas sp.]
MLISCPQCATEAQMPRLHRNFIERYLTRVDWHKHSCPHCQAIIYLHRNDFKRIELKFEKKLVVE